MTGENERSGWCAYLEYLLEDIDVHPCRLCLHVTSRINRGIITRKWHLKGSMQKGHVKYWNRVLNACHCTDDWIAPMNGSMLDSGHESTYPSLWADPNPSQSGHTQTLNLTQSKTKPPTWPRGRWKARIVGSLVSPPSPQGSRAPGTSERHSLDKEIASIARGGPGSLPARRRQALQFCYLWEMYNSACELLVPRSQFLLNKTFLNVSVKDLKFFYCSKTATWNVDQGPRSAFLGVGG